MIISRPLYLNRILPYVDKNMIKVLVGQRRVGKSYILKSIEQTLRERNPEANFITINLEDFSFSNIKSADDLHNEITTGLSSERKNYIFIDEIQEVSEFDKVIRSLALDTNNDIYITGSNSSMLSSEMASRLAGRSAEFRIHPLSYAEFLEFHRLADSEDSLMLYLRYGGMPYLRNLPDKSTWHEYLHGVMDALVYRDIVSRHSLRNNDFLQRLLMFISDNIGQIFTAKRIADYLKSQRINGTVNSVQTYADYICDAFIINKVRRWEIEGKRYFEIGEKYYFEDLGLRNTVIGLRPLDYGALLENAVFNHLQSQGYQVRIGYLSGGKEIDFIAEKSGEKKYIQVALNVDNPDTAAREFGNLKEIEDNYEKILVTLRDHSPNTLDGIQMVSLRQFLLTN
ncbi:MAG: ATP-binding protein [Muribaculaceae bacterium]|nr:ATP-binding protein [Muribaculaceae bacterium]